VETTRDRLGQGSVMVSEIVRAELERDQRLGIGAIRDARNERWRDRHFNQRQIVPLLSQIRG
jgi:hypothetical protein